MRRLPAEGPRGTLLLLSHTLRQFAVSQHAEGDEGWIEFYFACDVRKILWVYADELTDSDGPPDRPDSETKFRGSTPKRLLAFGQLSFIAAFCSPDFISVATVARIGFTELASTSPNKRPTKSMTTFVHDV